MTTLYRPAQITSAEQAEALPVGTSVKRAVWHQSGHQDYCAGVKVGTNAWFTTSPTADLQDALSRHMIGWTALVPIEAEERIGSEMCHQISDKRYDIHVLPAGDEKQASWQIENNPDYATGRIMRQYRTPWEEA